MIECSADATGIAPPFKAVSESIKAFIIQNQDKTKSLALFQPTLNRAMKDSGNSQGTF